MENITTRPVTSTVPFILINLNVATLPKQHGLIALSLIVICAMKDLFFLYSSHKTLLIFKKATVEEILPKITLARLENMS